MARMLHEPSQIMTYTRDEVRALDRWAIETLGVAGIVLMENAASAIEEVALEMLGREPGPVVIACGPGNNGGDGFALARKLANRGVGVRVVCSAGEASSKGDALANLRTVRAMGLPIETWEAGALDGLDPALIVDALLGTGMDRPARGAIAEMVEWINGWRASSEPRASARAVLGPAPDSKAAGAEAPGSEVRVLAVDIPTGLDCDTGEPLGGPGGHVVRADRTVTLAGLKKGFENPSSRAYTGAISVGDIGVPTPPPEAIGRAR